MIEILNELNNEIHKTAARLRVLNFEHFQDVDSHDDEVSALKKKMEKLREIRLALEDLV
jgi:hypothetical protein